MSLNIFSPATALFIRFYARCFNFPYEEMGYELQHMFRQLEREQLTEEDFSYLEQVLNVVNSYQGEELKNLRDTYLYLFGHVQGDKPACPYFASELSKILNLRYNADPFLDRLMDSDLLLDADEPLDSIINYLEYLSLLYESADEKDIINFKKFNDQHIFSWIPAFCDRLFRSSQISFYREVALGLGEFILESGEFQA